MAYEVPDLPYAYDALEPHIDEATMKVHHDKHHQAYVDKANAALEGTEWADKPVEEVIANLSSLPADKQGPVRNNDAAIFRFEPRTGKFQTYIPYGFANPHGRVFDYWGNDIVTDATGNANYFGPAFSGYLDYPAKHPGMREFWARPSRPCPATGILTSRHFPEEFQGNFLNINVISFQGIYRVSPTGEVTLVTDSITRPNGIGIFPGTQKMLIGCSDPGKPYWYLLDLAAKDGNKTPSVFYSAANQGPEVKGLPDGLKIDSHGNVFASGPGGIWFFNREGKLLGRYHLTEAASNCALSADEKTLYITNDMYVLRLKLHAADAPAGKE